jgi:uncharacterized protein (DUF362 family)
MNNQNQFFSCNSNYFFIFEKISITKIQMGKKINRRVFIKRTAAVGAVGFLGTWMLPRLIHGMNTPISFDIVIANGQNYFNSTIKSIEQLGGISNFVSPGQTVGLLINSAFDQKGAYVNPDIPLAIIKLCADAGAKEITCLQKVSDDYWKRSPGYEELSDIINNVKHVESNIVPAKLNDEFEIINDIPGARALKEAEVVKAISNCDVFINIPIAKHHALTFYTGAIKNMMGICTRKTNVSMHLGSGVRNNLDYLGQCIADINLYRKPDLIVVDATEFIISNGPGGPGEMKKPDKVVAGTDIVAIDALCCTYVNLLPEDIVSINKAYELGLGEIDYHKLKIKEINTEPD